MAEALATKWKVPENEAQELAKLSVGCIGWAVEAWQDASILETRNRRLERLTDTAAAGLEDRFAYAAEIAGLLPQQRTAVRETLDLWAEWWRDLLLEKASADDDAEPAAPDLTKGALLTAVREILRTQELLDMNINPRLALESLMLSLPKVEGAVSQL